MSDKLKPYLKRLPAGDMFTADEAAAIFDILMTGGATDGQIGAMLAGLAVRGETVDEIVGAARVLRKHAKGVKAPEGAVDCCGTGGDAASTLNISTAVSFVAAACGVPVAKHGNRAASSKSGAADVLEALGVNLEAGVDIQAGCLADHDICFLMAPQHHSAMRHVAHVRKELGFRTIFNLLGPLANPAGTTRQLIGVFDAKWMRPMAEALQQLGTEKAWIVHGSDGLDEITISGPTHVCALHQDHISEFTLTPEELGMSPAPPESIRGGEPEDNARALQELLNGDQSAYRDIVCLNAAAVLVIAGKVTDMKEGIVLAQDAIDSGRAKAKLDALIGATAGIAA